MWPVAAPGGRWQKITPGRDASATRPTYLSHSAPGREPVAPLPRYPLCRDAVPTLPFAWIARRGGALAPGYGANASIIYNPSTTLALSASCAVLVDTYAPRRQSPH